MMLVRTFLETKLAVGRLGWIFGYGSVRPTVKGSKLCRAHERRSHTGDSDRDDHKEIDIKEPVYCFSS